MICTTLRFGEGCPRQHPCYLGTGFAAVSVNQRHSFSNNALFAPATTELKAERIAQRKATIESRKAADALKRQRQQEVRPSYNNQGGVDERHGVRTSCEKRSAKDGIARQL
eukprot:1185120-Prorocentrum_minimum.AAC.6